MHTVKLLMTGNKFSLRNKNKACNVRYEPDITMRISLLALRQFRLRGRTVMQSNIKACQLRLAQDDMVVIAALDRNNRITIPQGLAPLRDE